MLLAVVRLLSEVASSAPAVSCELYC